MKKSLLNLALISVLGIGFSGCVVSTADKQVLKVPTNSAKTIEKEMFYVDTITKKEVTQEEFSKNIVPTFDYKKKYIDLSYNDCNEYGHCFATGTKTELKQNVLNSYFIRGYGNKRPYSPNNDIKVLKEYLKIFDINDKDMVRSLALVQIPFKYEFKNNKFHVNATYPNTFDNYVIGKYGLNDIPAFTSEQEIKNETMKSFSNLENIQISREFELSSEVNSEYNTESIEANFKRLLTRFTILGYAHKDFIQQLGEERFNLLMTENPYVISYNKELFPIKYRIVPYRNGTKVIYTVDLLYKLNSNGTATITDKDLDKIKKVVEDMVNN